MECRKAYVVLLDENGRYFKAANLGYSLGDTVTDPFIMKEPRPKRRGALIAALAAVAACLVLVLGIGYYQNNLLVYSHITMSINPQVRLDLNKKGEVVAVVGTNGDGKELLKGYSFAGKDKIEIADDLIKRAINMGYLTVGRTVEFDIDSPDDNFRKLYGDEISAQVSEYLMTFFDGASPEKTGSHITIIIDFGSPSSSGKDETPNNGNAGNTDKDPEKPTETISEAKAKEIALKDAGFSEDMVTFGEISLENEDGLKFYEIEFTCGGREYEYEIDALSGEVLDKSSEPIDDD